MTTLSTIEQKVDYAFFKALLDICVEHGYTPDITDDVLYPDTEDGYQKLQQDKEAIIQAKGFCVEIFGDETTDDKGYETYPRLVINSRGFLSGSIGSTPDYVFVKAGDKFYKTLNPPETSDYYLNIHAISGNVEQKILLNSIIATALPKRGYIKLPDEPNRNIFIRNINQSTPPEPERGIMERVYSYEITDLWESEPLRQPDPVTPINDVNLQIKTK